MSRLVGAFLSVYFQPQPLTLVASTNATVTRNMIGSAKATNSSIVHFATLDRSVLLRNSDNPDPQHVNLVVVS